MKRRGEQRGDLPALLPFVVPLICFVAYMVLSSKKIVKPVKRGFFRDDESISHPKGEDSFHHDTVLQIALLVTPIFIVLGSITEQKKRIFMEVFVYLFGFLMAMCATDIIKCYAGRLRPDFIDRCQPDYPDDIADKDISPFFDEDVCTGREHDIIQGRKSFPSGHAMSSAYGAAYLMTVWLRVEKRNGIHSGVSTLVKLVIFIYPVIVSTSRVSDYKHHALDAFAGSILGCLLALYTAFYLNGWVGQEATYFGGVTCGGTCTLRSSSADTDDKTSSDPPTVSLEKDDEESIELELL